MDQTTFVDTTSINATPERVWPGLTDPSFTTRSWRHPVSGGVSFPSDWQKGSSHDVAYEEAGLVIGDPEQDHQRVARRHRQPQDTVGDRVGPAVRLAGGLPTAVPGPPCPHAGPRTDPGGRHPLATPLPSA